MESATLDTERVTLIKEKLATSMYVDASIFHDAKLEVVGQVAKDLCIRLTAYVYRNADKPSVTIKVPKTAWEHVKQEYAPEWFLKRWPVKYTEITHEVRQIWTGVDPSPGREVIYQLYTNQKSNWFA
jgi:hypothetical protein